MVTGWLPLDEVPAALAGNTGAALTEVAQLPEQDFAIACRRSQAAVAERHGRWFEVTTALLIRRHAELAST